MIPVQCSTNWAIKPTGSWLLYEFVIYPLKRWDESEYMKIHIFELRKKEWISEMIITGFLFATAMIIHLFILSSVAQIYEFSYIHFQTYQSWPILEGGIPETRNNIATSCYRPTTFSRVSFHGLNQFTNFILSPDQSKRASSLLNTVFCTRFVVKAHGSVKGGSEGFLVVLRVSEVKVPYYSLWGSPDDLNNMFTAAHCEGENNKFKVKTIIQDNGCMLFYHALAKSASKQVAECPLEDWTRNTVTQQFWKNVKKCFFKK